MALHGRDPVFVYGALRSGTTLFRLMLEAHGAISNPGEVDCLFDHLQPDPAHPTGYRYRLGDLGQDRMFRALRLAVPAGRDGLDLLADFLDQLAARAPGVLTLNAHRGLSRIVAVLPDARYIHLLRDPRDVARSSIGMGWAGTLYHGVGHWIETETEWEREQHRIDPARRLTLTYEALIRDTRDELHRVCAFLGQPYRDAMLTYHENTTYERPDLRLIEQWRRKSTPAEVAQVEARAAALMQARGYALTGPVRVPGALARLRLTLADRIGVWRFGIGRYGPLLYLGEKVARRIGPAPLHRWCRRQMDARLVQFLK